MLLYLASAASRSATGSSSNNSRNAIACSLVRELTSSNGSKSMRKFIDAVLFPVIAALIVGIISFLLGQVGRFNQLVDRVEFYQRTTNDRLLDINAQINDLQDHNVKQYDIDRDRLEGLSNLQGQVDAAFKLGECDRE